MAMSYTRNYGPNNLMRSLYARKDQLDRTMQEIAYAGAQEIMEKSKAYAPIDEGHLENAHQIIERRTRTDNYAYDVYVDPNEADLSEYLDFIHNGVYDLGPLSEEKAATTGQPVGRKFLERAFDQTKPKLLVQYRSAAKRFTRL